MGFGADEIMSSFFPGKYIISSSDAVKNNPHCYGEVGRLVSEGIIVDIKEVWALQGDYYGILISVLIAAIGILGVVAFIYIKSTSLDQIREAAEKSAEEATTKKTDSFVFMNDLHLRIDEKFSEQATGNLVKFEEIDSLTSSLESRLSMIETRIRNADDSENEGSDLDIGIGEE